MRELNVVTHIKRHGLQNLIETFALRANYHKDYPNLVQLCYHQLNTPMNDITKNCRGLILDTSNDFKVVSFPFTRFSDYDYKNPKNNNIAESSIKFYTKEDGSICTLYFYDGKWNVSTKGLPDASGEVQYIEPQTNYNDYFWKVFNDSGYQLPPKMLKDFNCIFELRIPTQSFLVKTTKPELILIGIRNRETLQEFDLSHIESLDLNWKIVEQHPNMTIKSALDVVRYTDPTYNEGFVCVDAYFNRLKIKSPQYEAINQLRAIPTVFKDKESEEYWTSKIPDINKNNARRLLEIIRTNEHKTFLELEKYKPLTSQYNVIKHKFSTLKVFLNNLIDVCKPLEGKELGLKMKPYQEFNGLVFGIKQGKISSVDQWLYDLDIKKLETIINKKA